MTKGSRPRRPRATAADNAAVIAPVPPYPPPGELAVPFGDVLPRYTIPATHVRPPFRAPMAPMTRRMWAVALAALIVALVCA